MNQEQSQPQQDKVVLIKTQNGEYLVANQVPMQNANAPSNGLEKAAHPNICILHMFFKVVTAILYFLSSFISSSSLTSGLVIIIFGAFDFWVVKNLTGRFKNYFLMKSFIKIIKNIDIWSD